MDKVVITGATGYIGSNLARLFVKQKKEVYIIIRKKSKTDLISDIKNKIHIFEYDMDINRMIDFFQKTKPDVVYHLASLFVSEHNFIQLDNLLESNLRFGAHILEAMKYAEIFNFVNTGTSWQNFDNDKYNPVCLYAATKEAFENIMEYYVQAENLRAITLKLYDTYGPNDNRSKILNLFKKTINSKEPLDMSGGEQLLDMVYIDDVTDTFAKAEQLLLSDKLIKHERYFISSKEQIKLKEIAMIYESVNEVKLNINWGRRPYRKREVMIPCDCTKELDLGKPKITFERGLQKIKMIEHKETLWD